MNAASSASSSEVRLGLVGFGAIGRFHTRNLLENRVPGLRLSAICDNNLSRGATDLPPRHEIRLFTVPDELFASDAVDAVLICTPHFSHPGLALAALARGLHVLVEKPLAVHKADALPLLSAPLRPGQIFGLMLNQRTDPRYRRLRDLIHGGELGRINRIQWTITDWFRTAAYYGSGGWRATWAGEGGGILLNQCPHQLDLWQWLFGLPARVRAFGRLGRFHPIEVEDDVTAWLEYPDGAAGVFIATTGEAPGTNRLEVAGERGRVVIEGDRLVFDRNGVPASEWSRSASDGFAKPPVTSSVDHFADSGDQHVGILRNFTAAIRGGAPLIAPAAEGIAAVELANAMLLSLLDDATVALPIDPAAYAKKLQAMIDASPRTRPSSPA